VHYPDAFRVWGEDLRDLFIDGGRLGP